MKYKNEKIMSFNIFMGNLDKIDIKTDDKLIINTINPHSYVVSKRDKLFKEALNDSDLLLPDGSGIVLASYFLNKSKINKIAGADIHMHLLSLLEQKKGSVFYMGASNQTLELITTKVNNNYPNIRIGTYSPPYKEQFSEIEDKIIIDEINRFNPDILFIGMTAPKQEKWLHNNKDNLKFNIGLSIGAVFDFYAGSVNRPSKVWVSLHLEWLIRFLYEPKRLFRRNFISSPIFLFDLFLFLLGIKKSD